MRWFGLLLALVLILGAAAAAFATWLLATDSGTQFLSRELVKRVPELELAGVSGNLIEGVSVDRLSYRADPAVELQGLQVEIELWPLIDLQALHINRFVSDNVQIVPAAVQAPSAPALNLAELALPELPLEIYLHQAHIQQLTYDTTVLSDVHAAGAWTSAGLQLSDLRVTLDGIEVDGRAAFAAAAVAPMAIDLSATWFVGDVRGRLTAKGPLTVLNVTHRLYLPERSPVLSEGMLRLQAWPDVQADLRHSTNDPAVNLTTRLAGALSSWRIDAAGQVMGYAVRGQVDADLADTVTLDIRQARLADVLSVAGRVIVAPELQTDLTVTTDDIAPLGMGVGGDLAARVIWDGGSLDLELQSSQLFSNQFAARQLSMAAQGTLDQLSFQAQWLEGRFTGVARDLLSDEVSIEVGDGAQLNYADFRLNNSDAFTVRRQGNLWSVTPHCWSGLGEICIEASELSESSASMRGRLSAFQLNVVNDLAPLTFAPDSLLSGSWTWQMAGGQWQADAMLQSQDLNFTAAGRVYDWLPDVTLNTRVTPAAVNVEAAAAQPGLSWQAQFEAQGWQADGGLQGAVQLELDVATLPSVDPALQKLEGVIQADALLTGTIGAPQVAAQGNWQQGMLTWADPAMELTAIELQWQADANGWQVQGTAQSDQGGALTISGRGDGYDINANIEADVASTGLRLQSDMWDVTAIPSAHLTAAQGQVRFTGDAQIPTALVTVKTLPNALPKPVADVRVRGRPAPVADEAQNAVAGTLRVSLGDDVRLDLLALAVRLTGSVEAQIVGTEVVALHGELTVADGSLNASGQTLKVKEGRILFSGDPALPYVDLIATRDIKDYTPPMQVGLRISGRADALKTSVYSLPAMNETRALSFLVLGRDFNEASDADSNQLLSAAISLGLSQTQGVVEQLRGALGLDELSALAAEQNDVAIVAGKRITEDLYVRYSYNALSAVSALIIRYHLNERWRLEATNDVNSSMDLLYEFSR